MADGGSSSSDHPSLVDVLDAVVRAGEGDKIAVGDVLEAIGPRGFGPLILVPALIVVTPASSIPGLSSVGGLIIALLSVQYLIGRDHAWLPRFLRERSLDRGMLEKAINVLRVPAGWIDKVLARRLDVLTHRPLSLLLVGTCFLIGAVMPLFEFIPMSSSILAGVVSLIALALTTRDGVLALLAYVALVAAGFGGVYLLGWI